MAIKQADVRRQLILSLYDLLLSSDEESYWYKLSAIREYIDPEISGAQAKIAISALVDAELAERGDDGSYTDIYALSEKGVVAAENLVEAGTSLENYAIPPSSDLVLDNKRDAERIAELSAAIDELKHQFATSNAVATLPQSDKAIIADEITVAQGIAGLDAFRLKRLASFLLPVLRFLSDKFVGTALSEAAKQLIKLLLG